MESPESGRRADRPVRRLAGEEEAPRRRSGAPSSIRSGLREIVAPGGSLELLSTRPREAGELQDLPEDGSREKKDNVENPSLEAIDPSAEGSELAQNDEPPSAPVAVFVR